LFDTPGDLGDLGDLGDVEGIGDFGGVDDVDDVEGVDNLPLDGSEWAGNCKKESRSAPLSNRNPRTVTVFP
jgi:hypothetical protein